MKSHLTYIKDTLAFYLLFTFSVAFYIWLFFTFFVSNTYELISLSERTLFYLKLSWFTGSLVVLVNALGILIYGSPLHKNDKNIVNYRRKKWNSSKRLTVTYISRGQNYKALGRSINESISVLESMGVDYMIDIVTDHKVEHKLEKFVRTHFHVVHKGYRTEKGTKYKARALHYLIDKRKKPDHHSASHSDVWLLHLDEESTVTPSVVAGISKFINSKKNRNRIGQGEIKYNAHEYADNILISAADSIRTGDDLGRFRFQYNIFKLPLFGMHGSFILLPQHVENAIGFDLGPKQSITEDAYFAFKGVDMGYRFGWVDGYIREQSPFSVGALILQRRRWFGGLNFLAFDREIRLRTRFILIINMILWSVSWLGPLATIINLAAGGGYLPLYLIISAAAIQGGYVGIYLIGAYRNLQDLNFSFLKKIYVYLATFLLTPVVNIFEGISVIYAIVKPVASFDVVDKN